MANRLKKLREQRHLTQSQLAEQTGIARKLISEYENEKHEPRYGTWQKLAHYFGVSIAYISGKHIDDEVSDGIVEPVKQTVGRYKTPRNEKLCQFCHGLIPHQVGESKDKPVIRYIGNNQVCQNSTVEFLRLEKDQKGYWWLRYVNELQEISSVAQVSHCPLCGRNLTLEWSI